MRLDKKTINLLAGYLAEVTNDPLKFVETAFPWGKKSLRNAQGPQKWQKEVLEHIKISLGKNEKSPIKIAISSGHGIGKSTLAAWIILWSISTRPDTKGIVTANTERQLKTKTWAELAKWLRLSVVAPIFNMTSSTIFSADKKYEKTWRIDVVPWNANNTEAFAGLHNKGGRILVVFDEASAIDDKIWEVTEGAMTDDDAQIIWTVFGNPTRTTGMFRECFGRFRHRWNRFCIDARSSSITNKCQIERWIEDYGIDSDFVKIRVLGQFPSDGGNTFIRRHIALSASLREVTLKDVVDEPKIMGIDIARFGDDASVIVKRKGRLCMKIERFRKLDTMTFASIVAERIKEFEPDAVFADSGGVGGGVIDRLHQLGFPVTGVEFGGKPSDKTKFLNKRAEMWGLMGKWLADVGKIPKDDDLIADISAPTYSFSGDKGQIVLEKKDEMKKRGLASPDAADALALTFAYPVTKKDIFADMPWRGENLNDLTQTDL